MDRLNHDNVVYMEVYRLDSFGGTHKLESFSGFNGTVQLADTRRQDVRISTVFLSLSHGVSNRDLPVLFETMIFYSLSDDEYQFRYDSISSALQTHLAIDQYIGLAYSREYESLEHLKDQLDKITSELFVDEYIKDAVYPLIETIHKRPIN